MTEPADGTHTSDGARRLALRRAREARWPPLFHGAFRPFFLCCAIWFPFALLWWVAALKGIVPITSALGPIGWHRHELLFGGAGAAIAGYILTATPNWSGRLPANGARLLAMVLWWSVARALNASPPTMGAVLPAVVDTGFLVALTAACGREACHGKGRGAVQILLLALLASGCAASHVAANLTAVPPRAMTHFAVALIVVLISVTAGRLVPSFTRNVIPHHLRASVSAQQGRFDTAEHTVTAAALLVWLIDDGGASRMALMVAALVQAARLARWRGWQVRHEPSVFALHVAYAWVPIGLAVIALSPAAPVSAALHALTAGAVPAMILAVMARVSITQTGQQPMFRNAALIAVTLVSIGAAVRVAGGWHDTAGSGPAGWIVAATGLILGFCTFLVAFAGPLFRQRGTAKRSI